MSRSLPDALISFFKRFCMPPVIPSQVNDKAIYTSPIVDVVDDLEFFLSILTSAVPRIILATCKYSLKEYLEPPIKMEPIITGTILPDLANVTTGKDICDASANDVKVLANTCDVPT